MKKIFNLAICSVLVLALTACSKKSKNTPAQAPAAEVNTSSSVQDASSEKKLAEGKRPLVFDKKEETAPIIEDKTLNILTNFGWSGQLDQHNQINIQFIDANQMIITIIGSNSSIQNISIDLREGQIIVLEDADLFGTKIEKGQIISFILKDDQLELAIDKKTISFKAYSICSVFPSAEKCLKK